MADSSLRWVQSNHGRGEVAYLSEEVYRCSSASPLAELCSVVDDSDTSDNVDLLLGTDPRR